MVEAAFEGDAVAVAIWKLITTTALEGFQGTPTQLLAALKAVMAYSEFLEREGVIWEDGVKDPDFPRMKARALVITFDYGRYSGIEIQLKDGALDRVYGNGVNPDPEGAGPPDIPHKQRSND